jgi:sec-independent protein translocase protein TatB
MLDIGWGELVLIGVVALIVVGPKDLPALFRTVGNFTGKARAMARDFQRSLEQAANESGVGDVSKSLRSFDQSLNAATDSARKFARSPMRGLAEEAVKAGTTPAPATDAPATDAPAANPPAAEAPAAAAPAGAAAPAPEQAETPAPPPAREPTAGQ